METYSTIKKCRICYSELRGGINLFGEHARQLFLQAKIRRYLSFTISSQDKLPKMVCGECCSRLDGFHKFATMALRNQEKMTKFFYSTINTHEEENSENKSLLHTYLTKGIKEKDSESSESEVTEMEVRIDPMTILQCCSDEDDDNSREINLQDMNEKKVFGIETRVETALASQINEEDNNKNSLLCQICSKAFTSETTLQMHMWGHRNQSKKILTFNNMQQTINHVVVTLEAVKQIDGIGHNKYTDDDDDDESEETDDEFDSYSTEKTSPCPICGKIISNEGTLKFHLETHRPKGRYACDICGRIFKTQCNLYRHKEYHGGVQYPCEVCGRVYPTNSTLRAHSITHSDLRPHGCPMCDKTFKRNQDLKFHINQHTGARPYRCPYCPKAFASSGNCFSHRKRMHPLEVERDKERAAKLLR